MSDDFERPPPPPPPPFDEWLDDTDRADNEREPLLDAHRVPIRSLASYMADLQLGERPGPAHARAP